MYCTNITGMVIIPLQQTELEQLLSEVQQGKSRSLVNYKFMLHASSFPHNSQNQSNQTENSNTELPAELISREALDYVNAVKVQCGNLRFVWSL